MQGISDYRRLRVNCQPIPDLGKHAAFFLTGIYLGQGNYIYEVLEYSLCSTYLKYKELSDRMGQEVCMFQHSKKEVYLYGKRNSEVVQ